MTLNRQTPYLIPQQRLLDSLCQLHRRFPHHHRLVVAFSGGLDSTALLHACTQTQAQWQNQYPAGLAALHVHHGLSCHANGWTDHCREFCQQHQIPLQVVDVTVQHRHGDSLEERAREARYKAFGQALADEDILLLAHHQNDQAETVLLNLLRGSGEKGLSGMPASRYLSAKGSNPHGKPGTVLHRPWLDITREVLLAYAQSQRITWIDDDSNSDTGFDRNYLRLEVLPLIQRRWPGWCQAVNRSATLSAEADELLQTPTSESLAALEEVPGSDDWQGRAWLSRLPCDLLQSQPKPWQFRILRYWLQHYADQWPDRETTRRCLALLKTPELPQGSQHKHWPLQHWKQFVVQVYRGHLYLRYRVPPLPVMPNGNLPWHSDQAGHLPALRLPGNGLLQIHETMGAGMSYPAGVCEVRYRQGGEQLTLAGRPHKTLKKVLQEAGVLPWLRDRVPLLYVNGQLACIAGVGVCEGHQAAPGQPAWVLNWQTPISSDD